MVIRFIAWSIWALLLLVFLGYMPVVRELPAEFFNIPPLTKSYQIVLEMVLVVVALLTAATTILIRHVLLMSALRRGRFDIETEKGKIRFALVYIVNWLIAAMIAIDGVVFALITKRSFWAYGFFVLYLSVMIFHAPRLSPFNKNSTKHELI